ncbi:hypothetical protein CA484_03050 [Campylobacter jejuni]|nr:hypothetical protein [Campylobacter jejuni]ECR1615432.1 hypothetical protein [Campylobacter jejuni]
MTHLELMDFLDYWDKKDKWLFTLNHFAVCFHKESLQNLKISLSRLSKKGYIVHVSKGLYANPRTRCSKLFQEYEVANHLRNKGYSYLSLETLLSQEGLISQIPNRLTFVSLKFSHTYHTPYGIIEYVQKKENPERFFDDCYYDENCQVWVANPKKAIDDIYRFNRSVDLYEEQKMKDEGYYGF